MGGTSVGENKKPKSQDIISADSGTFQNKYFLNLRTSEIHLFYNLQLFYWHFLEFLWLFIFQVFYFSFLFSLLLEVAIILLMIGLLLLEIDVDTISVVSLVTARQEIGCDARFIFGI